MTSITKTLRLYGALPRVQPAPSYPHISTIRPQQNPHYPSPTTPYAHRTLSTSSRIAYPRANAQHKDSINTEATEYSKSATDDEGARQEEAAFDPSLTDPQQQMEKAGENTGGSNNPLGVSPANPDVSQQRSQQEGGAQNGGSGRERTSGKSSPNKGSKVA